MSDAWIRLSGLEKSYPLPAGEVHALRGVDLSLPRGSFIAVIGRSGSGKSTFLSLIAGLDRATRGSLEIGGVELAGLDEDARAAWRGPNVGVVFQSYQLLPTLSVAENVALPMDFLGRLTKREARARALELLGSVGIRDQADKLPSALSGGQQQRAAIARALANDPPLIVADEPTGNLDEETAEQVLALLFRLRDAKKTVLVVTHDPKIRARADQVVGLADGRVVEAPHA
ncbi:MAG: ABC transporter ATP-binding protein [Myxococcota bacterium]